MTGDWPISLIYYWFNTERAQKLPEWCNRIAFLIALHYQKSCLLKAFAFNLLICLFLQIQVSELDTNPFIMHAYTSEWKLEITCMRSPACPRQKPHAAINTHPLNSVKLSFETLEAFEEVKLHCFFIILLYKRYTLNYTLHIFIPSLCKNNNVQYVLLS